MKKLYKRIMNHWSKNIWESRIIILKRFRFHPRYYEVVARNVARVESDYTSTILSHATNNSNGGYMIAFSLCMQCCFVLPAFLKTTPHTLGKRLAYFLRVLGEIHCYFGGANSDGIGTQDLHDVQFTFQTIGDT